MPDIQNMSELRALGTTLSTEERIAAQFKLTDGIATEGIKRKLYTSFALEAGSFTIKAAINLEVIDITTGKAKLRRDGTIITNPYAILVRADGTEFTSRIDSLWMKMLAYDAQDDGNILPDVKAQYRDADGVLRDPLESDVILAGLTINIEIEKRWVFRKQFGADELKKTHATIVIWSLSKPVAKKAVKKTV